MLKQTKTVSMGTPTGGRLSPRFTAIRLKKIVFVQHSYEADKDIHAIVMIIEKNISFKIDIVIFMEFLRGIRKSSP